MLRLLYNIEVFLVKCLTVSSFILLHDPDVLPVQVHFLTSDHYSSGFNSKQSTIPSKSNI